MHALFEGEICDALIDVDGYYWQGQATSTQRQPLGKHERDNHDDYDMSTASASTARGNPVPVDMSTARNFPTTCQEHMSEKLEPSTPVHAEPQGEQQIKPGAQNLASAKDAEDEPERMATGMDLRVG